MIRLRSCGVATLVVLLAGCPTIAQPPVDTAPRSTADAVTPAVELDRASGPERLTARSTLHRPPQPSMSAAYRADLVSDHCVDRDLPAPPVDDLILVVLDRTYALSPDYVPGDLVPATAAGLTGASGTRLVRAALVEDLAAMAGAWDSAGLSISIDSAYRSHASQAVTFATWTARLGPAEAMERTARPGHSEHQLGTALDLTSPGWSGRFGDWAVDSAEGAWMAEHGWEYGFVMSYPAGGRDATCFSYEPWHYRWIGREAAATHRESGFDLRRFLERYAAT